jgi:glycerate kinase
MKIVLAPDSFKGSASAARLCDAFASGIRSVLPDAELVKLPLADGGEGTMEHLVAATGGQIRTVPTVDPLGRPIEGRYGVLGDGKTAVIELAEASGLTRLAPEERDPRRTTTYGTGLLIKAALDAGIRSFLIGLGGSATNDGGAGLLQALGLRLLDEEGRELERGGAALARLAAIVGSSFDPRIRESRFVAACDVDNPLTGPNGASAVFGPQKGADAEAVRELDAALERYAAIVAQHTGVRVRTMPGAGAAGGAGAALFAFLNAGMKPGAELVMQAAGFAEKIRGASWIVTGEGRLDSQTASGKLVSRVCAAARKAGVPVIALCGSVEPNPELPGRIGLTAAFALAPGPCGLEEAMASAERWAEERAAAVFRLIAAASKSL